MRLSTLRLLLAGLLLAGSAPAQGVIWSGPTMTFSNAPGSDWTQPSNADHLTDNMWFTRNNSGGLFNYFEGNFTKGTSPTGSEWALGSLNNYAALTYTDWTTCFGGRGNLATTIVSTNAVVHLVADDVYFAIKFTYWGGNGGGFAYERSSPALVPEPTATAIFLAGVAVFLWLARKHLRRLFP